MTIARSKIQDVGSVILRDGAEIPSDRPVSTSGTPVIPSDRPVSTSDGPVFLNTY